MTCSLLTTCGVFAAGFPERIYRLRLTGCSVSCTWMHLYYERYYGLGMDGLAMGSVQHERHRGLGMDALVVGRSRT